MGGHEREPSSKAHRTVASLMGHRDLASTMRYARPDTAALKAATAKLGGRTREAKLPRSSWCSHGRFPDVLDTWLDNRLRCYVTNAGLDFR